MALNLSIKNVPDALAEKLRRRAEANHRSLQGELMAIVESSVNAHYPEFIAQTSLATRAMPKMSHTSESISTSPETLTLRDIAERMRSRFPSPVTMPAGMSAVEVVRQMRDERDGGHRRNTDHHANGN